MPQIQKKFPFFAHQQKLHGHDFVYLDNAATSHKPQEVIDAEIAVYTEYNANVHRGLYTAGEQVTQKYEEARSKVAQFINAQPDEVVFTSGTTASINMIAESWGRDTLKSGDEIVVTQVEHHANLLPWQRLAQRTGATLRYIPLNQDTWQLEPEKITFSQKTKLVAITHQSNVLGPVWNPETNQLKPVIAAAHAVGAKVLLDAAQTAPYQGLDLQDLPVDFAVFSGHKMYGPTGIGVLYINEKMHDVVEPCFVGGSMVQSAGYHESSWQQAPLKFEAGTPPIAQAIGLGAAIDFLTTQITNQDKENLKRLTHRLLDQLQTIPHIKILGNQDWIRNHGHLVSFTAEAVHAHDIAAYLSSKQIAVRAGHHCAQPLFGLLNIISSVRVSLSYYNTEADIDRLITELRNALTLLR
jgi:cysteine desulfurase/selenocysteine lyase